MNYERNLTIGVDGYTNDELIFLVYGDTSLEEDVSVGGNLNIVGILTANRIFSNVYGEFTGSSIVGDTIVGSSLVISGITTLNHLNVVDINSSGIITSTRFSTGNIGTAINITSDTITGPSTIIIDPSGIGDATGSVRIKGDLYVDGTNFLLNKIDIDDFGIGIATQISSNIILDGAGIGIGSDNIKKTLTYEYDSDSLKSSENFDLADGKVYKINGVEVLSSTQVSVENINSSGIASVKDLRTEQLLVTGISTLGIVEISSGIITATSGIVTYYGDGSKLEGITVSVAEGLTGTPNIVVGIVTATEYYGVFKGSIDAGVILDRSSYADIAGIATYATIAGIATNAINSNSSNYSSVSGISTVSEGLTGTPNIVVGIVTATEYYGVFKGSIDAGVSLDRAAYAEIAGISTHVIGGIASVTQLSVSGLSTFTGIGTFIDDLYVGGNLNVVGILTANRIFSSIYGEFTGGTVVSDSIVGTALSISGISTLGTVQISSNLGIGTINPTEKLGVNGNVLITGIVTATEYYGVFKGSIDSGVTLDRAAYADVAGISTVSEGLTGTPNILVGIVTATDFNSTSDVKLKTNIQKIENPIDTIMKIDGVNFEWKMSGKKSMGVIAQQLENTIPQLVSGTTEKTVNYNGLIGLLIEVVKDQQKQIDDLRKILNK